MLHSHSRPVDEEALTQPRTASTESAPLQGSQEGVPNKDQRTIHQSPEIAAPATGVADDMNKEPVNLARENMRTATGLQRSSSPNYSSNSNEKPHIKFLERPHPKFVEKPRTETITTAGHPSVGNAAEFEDARIHWPSPNSVRIIRGPKLVTSDMKSAAADRTKLILEEGNRCPVVPAHEYLHELSLVLYEHQLAELSTKCGLEGSLRGHETQDLPISEMEDVRTTLREYTQAIRDYREFLQMREYRRQARRWSRRWILFRGAPSDPVRDFISFLLPTRLTLSQEEWSRQRGGISRAGSFEIHPNIFMRFKHWYTKKPARNIDPVFPRVTTMESPYNIFTIFKRWYAKKLPRKLDPEFLHETKGTSTLIDKLARFLLAIIGGSAIVVPVVIMVLEPSSLKSLVTTSVAVVLFAGLVSLVGEASNQEILVATATYAAVLIVFVGTSGTATG